MQHGILQKNRERLLCVALFFLPHAVYPYLFRTPFYSDFYSAHGLLLRFLYTLKTGHFALWSPLMHGGMPSAYELSMSGGLSPLYWLVYSKFPSVYSGDSLGLFVHLKLFVLGAGAISAFLYFKKLSGSFWGALLAALTFTLNVRVLDTFRYSSPLDVYCLLPVLFIALEKMAEDPKRMYGIFYSLALSIMLLSGQLQYGVFNLVLLAAYFFAVLLWKEKTFSLKKSGSLILRAGVFSALGLALASPLLLPLGLDAIGQLAQRASESRAWTDSYAMSLPTFAANFGLPWLADVHSSFYASMAAVLLFFMALALLASGRVKDREKRISFSFFSIFFIFCVLYSMGSKTFVSILVNQCLPMLKFTRAPGRIMGAGVFCVSALVALAIGHIETLKKDPKPVLHFLKKILAALFLAFAVVCVLFFGFKNILLPVFGDPYTPFKITADASMLGEQGKWFFVFGFLSFLGVVALLGRTRRAFVTGCLILAGLMVLEARVYHPLGTWYRPMEKNLSYREFVSLDTFYRRSTAFQPSGQSWPVEPGKHEIQIDAPKALGEFLLAGGVPANRLYGLPENGLLFFTDPYIVVDSLADALKSLDAGIDLRQVTLLSREDSGGTVSKLPEAGSIETNRMAKFNVLERTGDKIRFTIEAPTDGIVNYLENYHPAFRATVDGKPQKIVRTYGTFKGIFISKGKHTVTMVYDPLSFRIALTLFGVACVVLLGLASFQVQKLLKTLF